MLGDPGCAYRDAGGPFIDGAAMTIADIVLGCYARRWFGAEVRVEGMPVSRRWRPGMRRLARGPGFAALGCRADDVTRRGPPRAGMALRGGSRCRRRAVPGPGCPGMAPREPDALHDDARDRGTRRLLRRHPDDVARR